MKKYTKQFLNKAIDSLILSIEHFNRPSDRGRKEAVLIFLDHSLEMLLKAALVDHGGKIRENPDDQFTIGFDKCVNKALTDGQLKFLVEDQAASLRMINGLRDAAQHEFVDDNLSEQYLYFIAQTGVTLFDDILKSVFNLCLGDYLPERVLPVSTLPLSELPMIFEDEFEIIQGLLLPGKRKRMEAFAKIRTLAITDNAIQGNTYQPSEKELKRLAKEIQTGTPMYKLFIGLVSVDITASGTGPSVELRIVTTDKGNEIPIRKVDSDSPDAEIADVVAVKRVNELGFYNLGPFDLAKKVGLTPQKCNAMIWHLKLQSDPEYFKLIRVGRTKYKRYSQKAIPKIKEALTTVDLQTVWSEYSKLIYRGKKKR